MHRLSAVSILLVLSACRSESSTPGVTLSPTSPTTLDDIVAGVDNCDDCQFRWFKNGERILDIVGDTVSSEFTASSDSAAMAAANTAAWFPGA